MQRMKNKLSTKFIISFFKKEEGQTLGEYALILLLIVIVVIVALSLLGANLTNLYQSVVGAF